MYLYGARSLCGLRHAAVVGLDDGQIGTAATAAAADRLDGEGDPVDDFVQQRRVGGVRLRLSQVIRRVARLRPGARRRDAPSDKVDGVERCLGCAQAREGKTAGSAPKSGQEGAEPPKPGLKP